MSDEINHTLGRIEGTLIEFKENSERRFDEISHSAKQATEEARTARVKAEAAHEFSKLIVQKAGFMGGVVSFLLVGFVWVIENIPKVFAAVVGAHQ